MQVFFRLEGGVITIFPFNFVFTLNLAGFSPLNCVLQHDNGWEHQPVLSFALQVVHCDLAHCCCRDQE